MKSNELQLEESWLLPGGDGISVGRKNSATRKRKVTPNFLNYFLEFPPLFKMMGVIFK